MQINSLTLLNYKNITEAELQFSTRVNCFIGDNGMGKTNILDALYYLSFCKSFSNSIDSQNINHNADFFLISGKYNIAGTDEEILCSMKRKQKKLFKRNKKEYERLSDHIGLLPLVFVSPDDNILISDGSEERRKFIDGVISQCNNIYLQQLIQHNNALRQRNALLKAENAVDNTLYEIWEEQLILYGTYIFEQRKAFLEEFIPIFRDIYHRISGGNESIELAYQSQYALHNMRERIVATRERDKILGYTTQGIHKDELEMLLDGFPIKRVGSQGQNKTYLVSLKLAQYYFLQREHQFAPILLLDDIFDKLDSKRVEKIMQLVSGDNFGQIFITDTNREHLDKILSKLNIETSIFQVNNGQISTL